jgi:hypothetical protein
MLTLLGRRALRVDGIPPESIRISSRRGWALLAYLAMQPGRAASREQIAACCGAIASTRRRARVCGNACWRCARSLALRRPTC